MSDKFTQGSFYDSFITSRESLLEAFKEDIPLEVIQTLIVDKDVIKTELQEITTQTEKILTDTTKERDFKQVTKNSEKCAILLNLMKASERHSKRNSRLTRITDAISVSVASTKEGNVYDNVINKAGETEIE